MWFWLILIAVFFFKIGANSNKESDWQKIKRNLDESAQHIENIKQTKRDIDELKRQRKGQ